MSAKATNVQFWEFTPAAFDSLLALLDPDRERAGVRYEDLRSKLISFFRCRRCMPPEEWADETLDRLSRRSLEEQINRIEAYAWGVARRVAVEAHRTVQHAPEMGGQRSALPELIQPDSDKEQDLRMKCLEECLGLLSSKARELILEYYRYEKSEKIKTRTRIAVEAGGGAGTLRVRAYRIRKQLEDWVKSRMEAYGTSV